jgi:hypothetical protein
MNMNRETVRQITADDLGYEKNVRKDGASNLGQMTRQRWLHISSDLLHNAEMSDRVITGDETWSFQCDLETQRQSMQWKTQKSPSPKIHACLARSSRLCLFFFSHKER